MQKGSLYLIYIFK